MAIILAPIRGARAEPGIARDAISYATIFAGHTGARLRHTAADRLGVVVVIADVAHLS